jgi:hypothetical protein
MPSNITPDNDRKCPIYEKVIDGELCYETALCMQGFFKLSSVPESKDIKLAIDEARKICVNCPYSDME